MSYIPWEQREVHPMALTIPIVEDPNAPQPWDNLGGPRGSGAFYPGLFPSFITDGRVFECPSRQYFGFSDLVPIYDQAYAHFETSMAKYLTGDPSVTFSQFWSPYIGNVFGRIDRPRNAFGHAPYNSYFIQSYYPYSPDYLSTRGAWMWDVGSYWFGWGDYAPNRTKGCHWVGGNELFIDGSVKWRKYSWVSGP